MKVDVSIIGAGPAGLSAAVELAKNNFSVVVIDEYYRPGGRLLGQLYEDPNAPMEERKWDGQQVAEKLIQEAKDLGVTIICGVTAWSVQPSWKIQLSGEKEKIIKSSALLLATGAAEIPLPMPGWTLPGVYSIGAAQTFTNVHKIGLGKRVMVIGTDPLALSVVMEMKQAGIDIIGVALPPQSPAIKQDLSSPKKSVGRLGAVADLAPNFFLKTMGKLAAGRFLSVATHALKFSLLKIEGIPIYMRKAVISINGKHSVESVTLQSLQADGELASQQEQIAVDTVCLSAGLYPLVDLVQVTGCPIIDVPELGGLIPVHGPDLSTPVPGLFVAGNIIGIEGAKVAMEQGRLAAVGITECLGGRSVVSIEAAIDKVKKARELAPISFLPNINKGRRKMEDHWKHTQQKEGLLS